jgi:hypothetical protein
MPKYQSLARFVDAGKIGETCMQPLAAQHMGIIIITQGKMRRYAHLPCYDMSVQFVIRLYINLAPPNFSSDRDTISSAFLLTDTAIGHVQLP